MALRTIIFLIGLVVCTLGSLLNPLYGVIGYVCHYLTWPEMQWWGRILNPWGVRYSMLFASVTAIGMFLNVHRLHWGRSFIKRQELLIILFLLCAYVTDAISRSDIRMNPWQDPHGLMLKLFKVTLFVLMLSHVVTDVKRFRILVWVLVSGSLYLGYEAYNAPEWMFLRTRINFIGGPDFGESSFFGAHLVAMLPFIGIFFLCGSLRMKLFALVAGGFTINAIVLTRTRAAFVALIMGMVAALLFKIRRRKLRLILCLAPALLLAYSLTDDGFWLRMDTILDPAEEREQSAAGRLEIWEAAKQLIMDYPLGTGAGSFPHAIGFYDRSTAWRDAHNLFIRCAAELGLQSLLLLVVIIVSGWFTLMSAWRVCRGTRHENEIRYYCYATLVCQLSYIAASMFMSTLFVEEFWWFMIFPVCLIRCAENARDDDRPVVLEPDDLTLKPRFGDALAPLVLDRS